MPTSYILVGGLLFGMIAGQISDALFNRAAAALDPETREKIYQRHSALALTERFLEGLCLLLIIVGIIKVTGHFPIKTPGVKWGSYAMAGGNLLGGLCMTYFGWARYQAYQKEPKAAESTGKARVAFFSVVGFEVLWTAVILWLVFTRFEPLFDPVKPTTGQGTAATGTSDDETPSTKIPRALPVNKAWVEQAEALKILGVDAEHLDLLTKGNEIRSKKTPNGLLYYKNDLTSLKEAEIPTKDALKERLKDQPPPPEEPPKKESKPDTDRNKLQE